MFFSDAAFIDELRKLFIELHPQWNQPDGPGYYFSVFGGNLDYRRKIFDTFYPLIQPHLDNIFSDYKVLAIIAQIKGVSNDSAVTIHQDLTVVDESRYAACTFWIPMIESTLHNGAIRALKGSQRIFRGFRTHTMDYQFGKVQEYIREMSETYPVKQGEALAFDPGTIHFSGKNYSGVPRMSLAVSVVSKDAPTELGYFDKQKGADEIEVYSVPENFWYLYNDFNAEREQRPAFGSLNRKVANAFKKEYETGEFIEAYRKLIENE